MHSCTIFREPKYLRLYIARWPGLLLQAAFFRRCRVKPRGCLSWPLWPLRGINKTACMGCQTDSDGRPGLPCELCRSGSLTDGKALPFEFECLLYPAYGSPPAPTTHPTPLPLPTSSDSIRVVKNKY